MSEEEEGHRDEVEIVEEDELEQLKGKVAELEQELQYYVRDISNIRQKAGQGPIPSKSDSGHPLWPKKYFHS